MTNSDRYSPDDYNADQIDEDVVEHQGTDKSRRVTGKRKPKATRAGTAATRARRANNDQDSKKAGADATAKSVDAKSGTRSAKESAAKKPTVKKPNAKKPAVKKATARKTATNLAMTNRIAKTALSKETTMKALAQQELVANSTARRKALETISSQSKPLQKGTQTAGTGIIWTLLGIGLAACGGTSYVEKPVTKTVPGDPTGTTTGTASATELATARKDLETTQTRLANTPDEVVTVVGGLIANATIFGIDRETGERVKIGKTNESGEYKLTEAQKGQYIRFEADLTGAVDIYTNQKFTGGVLSSLEGSRVISSLSTVIQEAIKDATDAADDDDDATATQSAIDNMLNKLFGANSGITLAHLQKLDNFVLPAVANSKGPDDKLAEKIDGLSIRFLASLKKLAQTKATAANEELAQKHYTQAVNDLTDDVTNHTEDTSIAETNNPVGDILPTDALEVAPLMRHARQVSQGRPTSTPLQTFEMFEDGLRPDQLDQVNGNTPATSSTGETLTQTTEKSSDSDDGVVNVPGDPKSPAADDTDGTREGAPLNIPLSYFNFSDRDSDDEFGAITFMAIPNGILTYVNTAGETVLVNAGGTVILADMNTGEGLTGFSFTPDVNFTGPVEITYNVHDMARGGTYNGFGSSGYTGGSIEADTQNTSALQTITIEVVPVNDRPTDVSLTGKTRPFYETEDATDSPLLSEAGYVLVNGNIRELNSHGNDIAEGESSGSGGLGASDVEDNASSEVAVANNKRPFSIKDNPAVEGDDSVYFVVVPNFEVVPGNAQNPTSQNPTSWTLHLKSSVTPKATGESYSIILVFTDSGGATVEKTVEIVQGVDEIGLYLRSTNDPDGGGDLDASDNAKEYSGHMNVLSQNRGGATLAEEVTRRSDREADNQDNTDDSDTTNDVTFSFTGGLPTGGQDASWSADGVLSGAVRKAGDTILEIRLVQSSKEYDDSGADDAIKAKDNVSLRIVERFTEDNGSITLGNILLVTLPLATPPAVPLATTGAVLQEALNEYFKPVDPANPDDHYDPIRVELAKIISDLNGLTFSVGPAERTNPAHLNTHANNIHFDLTGSLVVTTGIKEGVNKHLRENPNWFTALRTRNKEVLREEVTIEGGEITRADGTTFTFDGATFVVARDADGLRGIEAGERMAKTVYVYRSTDGTTTELRIADSSGIDLAALAANGEVFVIGTVATDGTYTPNMAAPTASWTLHPAETENLDTTDTDETPTNGGDQVRGRSVVFDLASDDEIAASDYAGDTHHNRDFGINARGDVSLGVGKAAPLPQKLAHLGDTGDYDARDADTLPSKTVILKKTVTEMRIHSKEFNGHSSAQIDGADNSGDDDTTNDGTFSYAARTGETRGQDSASMVSKTTVPGISFIFEELADGTMTGLAPDRGHNMEGYKVADQADRGVGVNELIVADLIREQLDAAGFDDDSHLMPLVLRQVDVPAGGTAHSDTLRTDLSKVTYSDGVFEVEVHRNTSGLNWSHIYDVLEADIAKGIAAGTDAADRSTILTNLDAAVRDALIGNLNDDGSLSAGDLAAIAAKIVGSFTILEGKRVNDPTGYSDAKIDLRAGWYKGAILKDSNIKMRAESEPASETINVKDGTIYLPDGTRFDFDGGVVRTFTDGVIGDGTQGVPNGSMDAAERVALTIYVSQDEGADTATTADDVWSAKAIETAKIGDLAGTTYYVIGTVATDGAATMGGTKETNATLTYESVTTTYVKHVINIANRDDNAPEFVAEDGFTLVDDATENPSHHLERTVAEHLTKLDGSTGEFTFTIRAEDPDNTANHGGHTTETITYAAAGDDGDPATPITKTDGNDNHLIKSVALVGGKWVVTLIDGALSIEHADIRTDSGRKFLLFEIEAKSVSTLDGAPTDGRTSTKNIFKLYLTEENEVPSAIALSDGVVDSVYVAELKAAFDALANATDGNFDAGFADFAAKLQLVTNLAASLTGDAKTKLDALIAEAEKFVTENGNSAHADGGARHVAFDAFRAANVVGSDPQVTNEAAFNTAVAAAPDAEALEILRLTIPANREGNADVTVGTITVTDSDAGDTHIVTLEGAATARDGSGDTKPWAELFRVDEIDPAAGRTDGTTTHTLVFIGSAEDILKYLPPAGEGGTITITLIAIDSGGLPREAEFTLVIDGVPDVDGAPVEASPPGADPVVVAAPNNNDDGNANTPDMVRENGDGSSGTGMLIREITMIATPGATGFKVVRKTDGTAGDGTPAPVNAENGRDDFTIREGSVDANGAFTADDTTGRFFLFYTGTGLNYEEAASQTVRIEAIYPSETVPFTGRTGAPAKADTDGDGDTDGDDTFAYSGGGATFDSNALPNRMALGEHTGVSGNGVTIILEEGVADSVSYSVADATTTPATPAIVTITVSSGKILVDDDGNKFVSVTDITTLINNKLAEEQENEAFGGQVDGITLSNNVAYATSGTTASLTIAGGVIYRPDLLNADPIEFTGATIDLFNLDGEGTPESARVDTTIYVIEVDGAWVVRAIATANIGNAQSTPDAPISNPGLLGQTYYILGAIASDATIMVPPVGSSAVTDGNMVLSKTVQTDVEVPVQNVDDEGPKFSQTDTPAEGAEDAPPAAPAIAGDATSFKKLDLGDRTLEVANGNYQLIINNITWEVSVGTGAVASIEMSPMSATTLTIKLVENANTVDDLLNVFTSGGAITSLTVAQLARLGLTKGTDPDEAQEDAAITAAIQQALVYFADDNGNRIITHDGKAEVAHDATAPAAADESAPTPDAAPQTPAEAGEAVPQQASDDRIDAESGRIDTGIRIALNSALDADNAKDDNEDAVNDGVTYRLKAPSANNDNNLVELVDTDGDGVLEIHFRTGQRPDFESERGGRSDGKYKFVVEAVSNSTLTGQEKIGPLLYSIVEETFPGFLTLNGHIVNVTIAASGTVASVGSEVTDIDMTTDGDQPGTVVTVPEGVTLEALIEAILGNAALRGALGLDDAAAAARQQILDAINHGPKVTEQVYEYNVADADEAPWDLGITQRSLGEPTPGADMTVIGLITWTDDGTAAVTTGSSSQPATEDGGQRTGDGGAVAGVPTELTDTVTLTGAGGHTIAITKVEWTVNGVTTTLDASDEAQRQEIAKRFVLDTNGQLVFVEQREDEVAVGSAADIDALRGKTASENPDETVGETADDDTLGNKEDGSASLLKTLLTAYNALLATSDNAPTADTIDALVTALQTALTAFSNANTALTDNVDADGNSTKDTLETAGDTLADAVQAVLTLLTDATDAVAKLVVLGLDADATPTTVTELLKIAITDAVTAFRAVTDTTVTQVADNRLGNGEVYKVTVSVTDDAEGGGNTSEQTIEVVQGTVYASGFEAIMEAITDATITSGNLAFYQALAKSAANMLAGITLADVPENADLKAKIGDIDGALAIEGVNQTTVTGFDADTVANGVQRGGLWKALQDFINATAARATNNVGLKAAWDATYDVTSGNPAPLKTILSDLVNANRLLSDKMFSGSELLDENADGSSNDGVFVAILNKEGETDAHFWTATAGFTVRKTGDLYALYYTGSDAGDREVDASHDVEVNQTTAAPTESRKTVGTGFTGWQFVQKDGDATNADGTTFAYDDGIVDAAITSAVDGTDATKWHLSVTIAATKNIYHGAAGTAQLVTTGAVTPYEITTFASKAVGTYDVYLYVDAAGAVTLTDTLDSTKFLLGTLTYVIEDSDSDNTNGNNVISTTTPPTFTANTAGGEQVPNGARQVAHNDFTGWHLVQKDGDTTNADTTTFAYDTSIWGQSGTPAATGTVHGTTPTTWNISVTIAAGNIYHGAAGTAQAITAGAVTPYEITNFASKAVGTYNVYLYVDAAGVVTLTDTLDSTKFLLGTVTYTIAGADGSRTVTVDSLTANTAGGEAVTNGQRLALPAGADVASEKFNVKLRDVNEAPEQSIDHDTVKPTTGEGDGTSTRATDTTLDISDDPDHITILTQAHFNASDPDSGQTDAAKVVYIITGYGASWYKQGDDFGQTQGWIETWNAAANNDAGAWEKVNLEANPDIDTVASFTQADINAGLVRFVHSGADRDANNDRITEASFTYKLRDDIDNAPGTPHDESRTRKIGAEQTATVTITNVNDAPMVDNVAAGTDGNVAVKTADPAARTFTEATPQTPLELVPASVSGFVEAVANMRTHRINMQEESDKGLSADETVWNGHLSAWKAAFEAFKQTKDAFKEIFGDRTHNGTDLSALIDAMERGANTLLANTISVATDISANRGAHFNAFTALNAAFVALNLDTNPKNIGGIILTNAMFGIVDVDTAAAEVYVTLWSTPAGNTDSTTAFVATNGQVTIDGVIAGVIQVQKTGDDPNTQTNEVDTHTYWANTNSFTLAELTGRKVRFVHDVKHNGTTIDLRIKAISNATNLTDRDQTNDDTTLFTLTDAKGLVRLTIEQADDHPVPLSNDSAVAQQGTPAGDQNGVPQGQVRPIKSNTNEVTIVEKGTALRVASLSNTMMGYEDYDSGDADPEIVYTITDISNLSPGGVEHVRVQKDINGQWATLRAGNWQTYNETSQAWENVGNGGNTFTREDLDQGRVRIEHMGPEPEAGNRSFAYTVTSGGHTTAEQTLTVNITPINDEPTSTAQSTTRVPIVTADSAAVVRITTTDEESNNPVLSDATNAFSAVTTPGQFTYAFVNAENQAGDAGNSYGDNAYFTIDNNGLVSFKSDAALAELDLYKKGVSETYTIRVAIADGGIGTGPVGDRPENQQPITIYREFTIQVRDMDIDWNDNGDDGIDDGQGNYTESQIFNVLARDTAANVPNTPNAPSASHTVTVIPVQGYAPGNASPAAASQVRNKIDFTANNQFRTNIEGEGAVFGDLFGIFTIVEGTNKNQFRVTYTVKEDNKDIQKLADGETLDKDYSFRIEYQDAKGKLKIADVEFTVRITGRNERPTAKVSAHNNDNLDFVIDDPSDTSGVNGLKAEGTWGFGDVDNNAALSQLSVANEVSEATNREKVKGDFEQAFDAAQVLSSQTVEHRIQGEYGLLIIKSDKTWEYIADASRLIAAQPSGTQRDGTEIPVATEVFYFRVSDGSVNSLETRLVIEVRGKRDKPVLQITVDSEAPFVLPNADTIDLYKKLTPAEQVATTNVGTKRTAEVPIKENDVTSGNNFNKAMPEANYADTALVTGRWSATDPDSHARLEIHFGKIVRVLTTADRPDSGTSYGGTQLDANSSNSVSFEGKYGTLILRMDGTWTYDLDTNAAGTGKGDRLAHGEIVRETFDLKIKDGWGDESNLINLHIAIMGRNDTPDEVASAGGIEGRSALAWVVQSDGSIRFTMGTSTANDDVVITKDGDLQIQGGDVSYNLAGTLTLVKGTAPSRSHVETNGGEITVINPAGAATPFKIVRSADGEVKLVAVVPTSGNPTTEQEFVLRTSNVADPATIGVVFEAGDRYVGDSVYPDDLTTKERAGIPIARGTLDGIDPDIIGAIGQETAADEHHFQIVRYNGDGGTTPAVNVTAPTPSTVAAQILALADQAWVLFQLKTKAAWDAMTDKSAYDTAFTAVPDAANGKSALGTAYAALNNLDVGATPAQFADVLAEFYTALKALGASTEVVGKFGKLTLDKYSGEWEYHLDNDDLDTQELNGGQVVYDAFTIIVTDEEGASVEKQVRIRVTGENDAAILYENAPNTTTDAAIKEKGGVDNNNQDNAGNALANIDAAATGRFGAFDIDAEDRFLGNHRFLSAALQDQDDRIASPRRISKESDGSTRYAFEAANRVDPTSFANADDDVNSTGDVSTDNVTATRTNAWLSAENAWIVTDFDAGQDNGADAGSVFIKGKFGMLFIDGDGAWDYHLYGDHGNTPAGQRYIVPADVRRVEKLSEGEVRQEHFAIRAKDISGTPSNVIHLDITVTGTNDAPTLGALAAVTVNEAGFDDAATPNPVAGTNANGTLVLGDKDAEHDATVLFSNDDFTAEIRQKTAIDNTGGAGELAETDYADVVGTDDDITVSQQASENAASPHHNKTVGMQFTSFDLTHGILYIWDDKTWLFVVDQAHADVNGLNHGQLMTKTIEVTITDARGASVARELVITITGANDAPPDLAIAGTNNDNVENGSDRQLVEDGGIDNGTEGDSIADGTLDFTDIDKEHDASMLWRLRDFNIELRHKTHEGAGAAPDWMAAHIVSKGDGNGDGIVDDAVTGSTSSRTRRDQDPADMEFRAYDVDHGTLYIYNDKSWRFELKQDHDEVQALDDDDTLTKTFGLTVVDSKNGKSSEVEFTVTITGANDAPTVAATNSIGTEGVDPTPADHINGRITITDVDGDDTPAGDLFDPTDLFTLTVSVSSEVNSAAATDDSVTASSSVQTVSDTSGVHAGKNGLKYHSYVMSHGTLFIYQDGSYRFDIDDSNGEVNGLAAGQTIVKTVTLVVRDGANDSAPATFTITINGRNDAPTGGDKTKTGVREDVAASFTPAEFTQGADAVDAGQTITHVVISGRSANGTLTLNGQAVNVNQEIAIADVPNLRYTSAPNGNGANHGDFKFRLKDSGTDNNLSAEYTMRVDVAAVNDVPTGSDKTKTGVREDIAASFTAADFTQGADAVDAGQTITHVVISGRSANGTLTLNGQAVNVNQEIAIADVPNLRYTSAPNGNGANHGDFKFRLKDSGTDNNLSAEYTMQVNVAAVQDPPETGGGSVTISAMTPTGSDQAQQTFSLNDFITDPDGDAVRYSIDGVSGVTYTPTNGSAQNLANYASWISISGTNLQITPQAEMKAGSYMVTITGTSLGGTHNRTVTFTVNDAALAKTDPTGPIAMSASAALGTIDYDTYFSDYNGRDQFTVIGRMTGPNGYDQVVNLNADGTLQGNLPDETGAYTLTLTATPVQGAEGSAQTVIITINAASTKPAFLTPPAALSVAETAAIGSEITNGDFNARAAGRSGQDAAGGVRYSLKGSTAADFMTDAEVNQYLEIDADGKVKVKAALPNQDDSSVAAKLRAAVKFIVVAIDTSNASHTTEHEVTLTITNVLDETPTFTPPSGLTATAGETVFADGQPRSLSATTTETGGSAADRVVEFRESPTAGHVNVLINENGTITLTGTPTAGRINFTWQWKYAGQNDDAWTNGGNLTITINDAPAAPAAPQVDDFNSVGDINNANRENLLGTSEKDLFLIDTTSSDIRDSNTVRDFNRGEGDTLRFIHDSAAANATDTHLYTWFAGTHLVVSDSGKDPNSARVTLLAVGGDFRLQDSDVWEDATITHLNSPPTAAPSLVDFTQRDGATRSDQTSPEVLLGVISTTELFLIDKVGGENLNEIDQVRNFSRNDGDMLHFGQVDQDSDNVADTVFNSEKMNLFVRLENIGGGSGGSSDDLVIYARQGETESVLAVMRDVGTDFALTNDDVWQDATIEDFTPPVL